MDDCFTGYGRDTFEIRALETFFGIEAGQEFDVFLTQDTTIPEQVIVRTGNKLLTGIKTDVKNGLLILRDENRCNWVRRMRQNPRCTVNVHRLESIHLQGAAALKSLDTLRGGALLLDHKSVYDLDLSLHYGNVNGGSFNCGKTLLRGFAGIFAFEVSDVGQLLAEDLRTEDIYLYHFSPMNSQVSARMWLEISVFGKGNVRYRGTPARGTKFNEAGQGKIIQLP
jgi:hypothetical protein